MNMRRLLAMAHKETLQVWRDPRSLAIALLMPLLQMVLLGYGVSLDIRRIPLCIDDQAHSQVSRELVQNFVASKWFSAVHPLDNERALRDAMDRGSCAGVVTIPVDFSRAFTTTGDRRQYDQYRHRLCAGRDRPDHRGVPVPLEPGAWAVATNGRTGRR
jgi:ABC-2 type transport system permease protein